MNKYEENEYFEYFEEDEYIGEDNSCDDCDMESCDIWDAQFCCRQCRCDYDPMDI